MAGQETDSKDAQQDIGSQEIPVPEEWEYIDAELIPLFEATVEWFESVYEQFYFSTGVLVKQPASLPMASNSVGFTASMGTARAIYK
ncbi:hypothetical protein [Haloarcula sp. K1]|uniref:hypothetical protein n=1 Tax=Haloarcula sp. K1 TaxID=1622207 RepID=UPI0007BC5782|nr:hypothetical protein [Haloarcula sp. K1]KZX46298.1 hypothetical protein AV929_16135 [Haloarcula sp. K1]